MTISQILVAVGAVIEDDKGRILLVKHKPERGGFWQGKWICPGGELELGEKISEGIKREVKEETNLDIALKKPLVPFERIVSSTEGTSLHVIYIDYVADLVEGDVKVGSDVGEALWIEKQDIGQIWEDIHDDTKKLLKLAGMV